MRSSGEHLLQLCSQSELPGKPGGSVSIKNKRKRGGSVGGINQNGGSAKLVCTQRVEIEILRGGPSGDQQPSSY